MIDISSAITHVMQHMKKTAIGCGLKLLTFKRDRHITIIRTGEAQYTIIEMGFENRTFEISQRELKKTLKTLLRREFHRSRKVRIAPVKSQG